ncbi:MAG: T9SS type A sorting domain-containing protein [Candidatus Marinimicrobia bacterium]|nr:T9SS type A sorting domain-containing protein [Candidatus Neomarinimicrobiota bacterium]
MKIFRLILLFFVVISNAFAFVWHVPDSLSTIQAAVDTAQHGDTVLVKNVHQNAGSVEIIGKKIALLSKNYISNPSTYNISSGAALYGSVGTRPLLTINNADSSMIKGFLFDQNGMENGGGIFIENSQNILIEGVYFKGNSLLVNNSGITLANTIHYSYVSNDSSLLLFINSTVNIQNSTWKNSEAFSLLEVSTNSEFSASNLAVYGNTCSSHLYKIGSSYVYFDYITSYGNTTFAPVWNFTSAFVNISNSILEYSPPVDIAQCEISYSAVPGNYPGTNNISQNPMIDTTGVFPVLLDVSPCISAANPDTGGIQRVDILGHQRPNPIWAPPDMGAYESSRYMLLNDDHHFWISNEGDDIWGNGSVEYPFASLQVAVDYALDTDTLLLLPGEYRGSIEIENKSLTISSPYLLSGDSSYVDSIVLMPDTTINSPIFLLRDVDSVKVSGLHLKDGRGRQFYNNYSFGGAVYCEGSGLELKNLVFSNNKADYSGGAVYALNSELDIDGVSFNNNNAYFGGAISLSASTALLTNVSIEDNVASSGGGIYAENNSKIICYYTNISNNFAQSDSFAAHFSKPTSINQYGGGIFAINTGLRLHNTLIDNNFAQNKGAAIATRYGELNLVQSTIADNSIASDSSAVIQIYEPNESVIIINSILWNPNEPELELENTELLVDHSLLDGNIAAVIFHGQDNQSILQSVIDSNPIFDDDYSLILGSPCFDQGLISYVLDNSYLINYDVSEYTGTAPDLGYTGAFPSVAFELELVESSILDVPEDFSLLMVYPNPFNPNTILEFQLENPGKTRLSIYNIRGQLVRDLVRESLLPGRYRLNFHASSLSSGIYIARLSQEGSLLSSKKLLLVK